MARNLTKKAHPTKIKKQEAVFRFDPPMTPAQQECVKALLALAKEQIYIHASDGIARIDLPLAKFKQFMQIDCETDETALETLKELQKIFVEVEIYRADGIRTEQRGMRLISEIRVDDMTSDNKFLTIFMPRTFKEIIQF